MSVGAINRLARKQHGVVTRRQLLELGLEPRAIDRRVEARRLIRIHRGIYRVGPVALPLETEIAAVLAAGADAFLSHRSAAHLHQLLPHPARPALVEVTVLGRHPKPSKRIHMYGTARLPRDEVTSRHRIPVTTPARTILDIAPHLSRSDLEQAVAQAHRKRLATPRGLHTLIARYPRRPGTPALRALLEGSVAPAFTRSRAERRLLDLVRRAGLTEPHANAIVAGYEVDFHWPEHRLVVEVDGPTFHSTRPDRRRDQARDANLVLLGFKVLRLDPDEIARRPEATVALLARATR